MSEITIDTGDIVEHGPSAETWTVAYVKNGRLAWCGWPPGEADVKNCTLVTAASDEARVDLLNRMAAMQDPTDARCRYAKWRLGIRDSASKTEAKQ